MQKTLLFIYNAHAGKGRIKNQLEPILDTFMKNVYLTTVMPTQKRGDACDWSMEMGDKYDLLVCSGGDGTLDEVISGMMKAGHKTPIGYIPAGSTNDFANSLAIPKSMKKAAKLAVTGESFFCDAGQFNKEYFIYIVAFGAFTEVSYETKQEYKNVLGHAAYLLEGMRQLGKIKSYRVQVVSDALTVEDEFIYGMVTNSTSVGGVLTVGGKNVMLDDGLFEVTLIKMPKNPLELQNILVALLLEQVDSKYMYSFKTSHVEFHSEDAIPWTLDGEYGGHRKDVTIENRERALELIVDTSKMRSKIMENNPEKLTEQIDKKLSK